MPLANRYGEHDFLAACREGNLEAVNVFLSQDDFDIDKHFPSKKSGIPIHGLFVAVLNGHAEVVQRLVSAGAKLNQTWKGYTPLLVATYAGHIDVIKILLNAKGIAVNQTLNDGATALMQAVQDGHVEIVRLLLSAEADPTLKWYFDGFFSKSPLTMARTQWLCHLFSHDERRKYSQIIACLKQANCERKKQRRTSLLTPKNKDSAKVTTSPEGVAIEMTMLSLWSDSKE
ncbi:ankyrin repeat domain-containing protein [Sansalvadorimonas verongulae]|uniref:ankyrin repeat domain-containing protein n=1 Tax=Sansalvadorimonas verongulae TaxID=2172824 RepID=UPI0018AD1BB3|nr:ankyrin repeat domain-containing protein [Sansalvadorimonas verongulae]